MTLSALLLLCVGWAIAAGSPGPATLAISGTSMAHGRRAGLAIASGVLTGSAIWGIAAALGLSAVMMANSWVAEALRYFGAAYLLFLAVKSLRSAMRPKSLEATARKNRLYLKGALIHLTNPKAIFAWGSVFAIAVPIGASPAVIWEVYAAMISTSATVFLGYAILFSNPAIARGYKRLRRWFEFAFAGLFGAASVKVFVG